MLTTHILTTSILQPLPQPIRQLRPPQLRQVIDTLFAKGVDPAKIDVLRWRARAAVDDNGGVGLHYDARVYDLVDGQTDEVKVFDDGSAVDGLSVWVGGLDLIVCERWAGGGLLE